MLKITLLLPLLCQLNSVDAEILPARTRLLMPVIEQQIAKAKAIEEEKERKAKEIKEAEKVNPQINTADLRVLSNVTAEQLNKALQGTGLAGLGQAYVQAEAEYKVNAIILCAITIQESGWGESKLTHTNNNISGTVWNGEYAYFNSLEDCISYTAKNIGINYLQETGIYHNGYSIEAVNKKYCFRVDDRTGALVVDDEWAKAVTQISTQILGEVSDDN